MAVHALEDLDDAYDVTRAFLWPVDRTRWIKLALVVLLVGGPGTNHTSVRYNLPADRVPPAAAPTWARSTSGSGS
ncbi:DUF7544 domain-containing protein [Halorarum salinum]|uniref:Uncharacterized protein n=1 Tax=Halorarum salinum TaxID=2743089 RepID=A0A7D5L886_9EURY|nr:hypothetical protein [Halobaculum salinum]QLG60368.1 hypothetical protein HUG12_00805 [Halobaculum salinum]